LQVRSGLFEIEVHVNENSAAAAPVIRSIGFWMAAGIALLQGVYAVWAFVDPQAFASYRGSSLEGDGVVLWVHAYGSRTLFVALVVLLLLRRGDIEALKWIALFGLVMPVSDAWSALQSTAPNADVIRHILTAAYLVSTAALLAWASRTRSAWP
jgi:hypothetical protein